MTNRYLSMYIHLIWGTWDRDPLITPQIERAVYRCIANQICQTGCTIAAINGVSDHIHTIIRLRSTVTVASLVKQAKGVTSKFINDTFDAESRFKWGAGYGAFTISRWDLPKIINYVSNQKEHHATGSLTEELEDFPNFS